MNQNAVCPSERCYSFDVLKIAATFLITFHHFQQYFDFSFEQGINFFGGNFYFGLLVELFFMLSGCFMGRYVDGIHNGLSFKTFFLRRYLRFLPLLAVSSIVFQLLNSILTKLKTGFFMNSYLTLWSTIAGVLGIHTGWGLDVDHLAVNNPTWYISTLLVCYIWFFFITWLSVKTKTSSWYWYGAMIMVGIWVSSQGIHLPLITPHTGRGFYSFFWGLLFGKGLEYKRKIYSESKVFRAKPYIDCLTLFVVLGIPLLYVLVPKLVQEKSSWIMTFFYYPALMYLFDSALIKRVFGFFRGGGYSKLWRGLHSICISGIS